MKVMITCPRAPVTIEWIRVFTRANIEVILVDSLNYPIARYFANTKYVKVASPKLDYTQYKRDMTILLEDVDWVIPNCEDIFYLTKVREEIVCDTFFFMPDTELLYTLHHKYDFFKYINEYVKSPHTQLINDKSEIDFSTHSILKPVFSRFGQNVIREVNKENIKEMVCSSLYPWVQQQKIEGKPICNYALMHEGKLIAHVAYRPKYLLNDSAATYFEPYKDKRLDNFVTTFAQDTGYTGQVAFDFIDDGIDLYILECNPRATSGLHLLSDGLIFKENTFTYTKRESAVNYRVGTTLYTLFGMKALWKGEFKTLHHDYKKAKDVLEGIPFYAQFLSFYEMLYRAIKYKKPLTQASTFDIEFDG
jgi:hypothetical protein